MAVKCQTVDCGAEAKLQCPTCLKLGIKDDSSWFCSQDCFKGNWAIHKIVHLAKRGPVDPFAGTGYNYTGYLRKFPLSARREVPSKIGRPDYADHPEGVSQGENDARGRPIVVQTDESIEAMRVVGKLARQTLDAACAAVDVGVTTDELDRIVHETAVELECYPSPLNYRGFPKSVCTSVNECICHGIPDMRPLVNGDLCNIDVTVYHRGYHGDLNETNLVGDGVSDEDIRLVQNTYECITTAINSVKPGVKYREVGNVIEKIARRDGFSVVKSYCGHGIHKLFHTAPNVPHYAMSYLELAVTYPLDWMGITENRAVGVMQKGHTFTIEPMINVGKFHDELWPDDWTVVTSDGSRSAQFEQTLLCTLTGVEILTKRPNHDGRPWFVDQLIRHGYKQAKEYTK